LRKSNTLIITDKGVNNAGLLKNIKKSLQDSNIAYDVFDEIESDPSTQTVEKGVALAKDNS